MAFLAFDPPRPIAPTSSRAADGVQEALAAIRRLAGAAEAHVLFHDDTGAVRMVRSTAADRDCPVTAALRASLEAETAFLLADAGPRWIDDPAGGQALLVKLAGRSTGTLFLLLDVADGSAVARARVMRSVPDLTVLVRHHLGLGKRLSDAEEVRDAAREALDHGECGVIAVRADHSVVFTNAAGALHLAGGEGLRLRRGLLRPVEHARAIRFEAALDSVIDLDERRVGRARASVMLLGGERDPGRPTIIVIAPGRAATADHARGAAAMIYILSPALGVARGLETLCQLHGMSRVETSLIGHLVNGLTLTEAAARMRIKVDTARTYLKQVFAKTGLHRQTDLVALMTRYLRAIRGDFDFRPA